jgi:hypothetical protein
MPIGIFLYEIDESFGPNILAEYYLAQENKVKPDVLKYFEDKHIQKEFSESMFRREEIKFFSFRLNAKNIEKQNLFLGFVFNEGEDLVSLKSIFENIGNKILNNFSNDRGELEQFLKTEFNSIFTLMEKLKQPALIKETINEKTKKMLDDENLQEARELINLGEEIPGKLAEEISLAEQLLKDAFYKKAKKSFEKAAELAGIIQEIDIVSFLQNKAEQVAKFPELIKEQESIIKSLEGTIEELHKNRLHLYHDLIRPIDRLVNISNTFEEQETIDKLTELLKSVKRADEIAKELFSLDKKIKENYTNL